MMHTSVHSHVDDPVKASYNLIKVEGVDVAMFRLRTKNGDIDFFIRDVAELEGISFHLTALIMELRMMQEEKGSE